MISNYFKIAFRNLLKNRGYSFINLFGLTVGLTCCTVIGFYIWNELSFDRYNANADRIWRLSREFFNRDGSMSLHLGHVAPPVAPLLKNDFPDIEETTRLFQYTGTFRKDEQLFIEDQLFVAEPNFLKIFTVPLVSGSPETALNEPYALMLSETTAKKYFNGADPVDQTLRLDGRFLFKITGVFKDFPYNSHFHPDMLASFATLRDTLIYGEEQLRTNWSNNAFSTFLLLPKGYPADRLEAQFPAFLDKNMPRSNSANNTSKPSDRTSLHLQPLTDIHLRSHLDSEIEENGDISRVYIFAVIALFVLFIACINYMNLSTARSMTRAKEIGIRKTVGAFRKEIAAQFLTEAVVLVLVSTVLATGLALLVLPFINSLLGQELQITHSMWLTLPLAILGMAVITGLLAGLYPAVVLSGFRPIQVLKGGSFERGKGGNMRKILVVGQFAVSAGLIIATLVVFRQLKFMQDKSLGLNKDHIVTMNFYTPLAAKYESFRNELLANPAVRNITRSTRLPSTRLLDSYGSAKAQLEGDSLEQREVDLKFITVDHLFAPTYELELAAGRNYLEDQGSDRFESFIVNEAAARGIGWQSPEEAVGKRIQYGGRDARIVGVYKDFNFESLHQDILPMIFFIPRDSTFFNDLSIKIDGTRTAEALDHIKKTWQTFLPDFPFDYQFLDQQYGRLYEAEQRQGRVFIGFALIAILIACLGLFGLAAFVAQQRVKEIGVRKVLGATTAGIVGLLSRDFLKLVLVALVIAVPLSWYLMNHWLQNFAYRIGISWWIFALAGVLAVLIAFVTVSFQSIRAALVNPVESLRSE
ncbi:MAG: ABC transporter permease [Lewinellaceae bacterium]|nr:ABC transporter permease [Lewinellaceae bacterium]